MCKGYIFSNHSQLGKEEFRKIRSVQWGVCVFIMIRRTTLAKSSKITEYEIKSFQCYLKQTGFCMKIEYIVRDDNRSSLGAGLALDFSD